VRKDDHIMEVTCKTNMMFIIGEYLGWDEKLLGRCIDHIGVPLIECFRNGSLFIGLLGMLER
jgi:hypothetical protein